MKLSETDPKHSRALLASALATTNDAIAVIGSSQRLECWSPAFSRAGILKPDEIYAGRPLTDIYALLAARGALGEGELSEVVQKQEQSVLADAVDHQDLWVDGKTVRVDRTFLPGGYIGARFSVEPPADAGRQGGVQQILHDVNNGLLAAQWAVEFEAEECPEVATATALLSVAMVLQDTAKLVAAARGGRRNSGTATCNAAACVLAVKNLLRRSVGERLSISSEHAAVKIPLRDVDFKRAILNLVANALEASPDALVHVDCATGLDSGKKWVVTSVRDDGCGMPPALLARAQTPGYTTKGGSGRGLGLSSVADVMASCGGSMNIESQVGIGTTVTLRIPIAET